VKRLDAAVVTAASAVAAAAILGGAFDPGPRLVVGALLAVALASAAGFAPVRLVAEEWVLFGLIIWGAVAAVVVASSPLAAREVLVVWVVAWGLWVSARRVGKRGAEASLIVLVAAGLTLALGVGCEAIGLGELRVGGLLENPNVGAALLVLSLPALLVVGGRSGWRLAAASVLVAGLVLTGSRAGLLAMLAVAAIILPRGRLRTVGLVIGATGAAAVLGWRFLSQPDILAWFRPRIWRAALDLWIASPLTGVGPGGLVDAAGPVRQLHADHVGQHQFLISYAESSPLAVLVQTGLVGFALATVAVLLWLRRGRRGELLRTPSVVAALTAMAVIGLFHDLLSIDIVLWWWALTIGLLEAHAARPGISEEGGAGPSAARGLVGLVVAFVVLWGIVQPSWARWLWRSAEPSSALVERAMRAEPWFDAPLEWRTRNLLGRPSWTWEEAGEGIAYGRQAISVHPGASRLWLVLAQVYSRTAVELGPWPDAVEGAREAFSHAVALEPHQPWGWLEWARFERNLGHLDTAVHLARRAVEEEPNAVRAWLFVARLELDRGEIGAARDAFDHASAAASLRGRAGLSGYERELLGAPSWQFDELEEALH
jgi:cytochrome c-type biogenesis protein CcmH/NrfG